MTEIDAQIAVFAYSRLEQGAIDDIDASMFSGDMFIVQSNRDEFIKMMDRWARQLKVWEEISEEVNEENEDA